MKLNTADSLLDPLGRRCCYRFGSITTNETEEGVYLSPPATDISSIGNIVTGTPFATRSKRAFDVNFLLRVGYKFPIVAETSENYAKLMLIFILSDSLLLEYFVPR